MVHEPSERSLEIDIGFFPIDDRMNSRTPATCKVAKHEFLQLITGRFERAVGLLLMALSSFKFGFLAL